MISAVPVEQEARPAVLVEVRTWIARTWAPHVAFGAALYWAGFAARSTQRLSLLTTAAVLLVATTWLGSAVQKLREDPNTLVRHGRIATNLALIAAVILGDVVWHGPGPWWGPSVGSGVAFLGIGLVLLALGGLVKDLRLSKRWPGTRGPVVLLIAGVGLVVALCAETDGPLIKVALAVAGLGAALGCQMLSEDWIRDARHWATPWPYVATADGCALGLLIGIVVGSEGWLTISVSVGLVTAVALVVHRWLVRDYGGLDDHARDRRRVAWLGAILLLTGILTLDGLGTSGGMAATIAVVLFVVVWFVTARSDNLLVTIIVAGALLWAAAPRTEARAPQTLANDRSFFVTFGDSYISGEGATVYQDGTNTKELSPRHQNECRRANTAWPVLLAGARAAGVPTRVHFVACSGAVSEQLTERNAQPDLALPPDPAWTKAWELELYQQDHGAYAAGADPKFALLSIGGNDAQFSTIGKACVGPGSCADFQRPFLRQLRDLPEILALAYRSLAEQFQGRVPIIVVPYPDPIAEGEGECAGVFLEDDERTFIRTFLKDLNDVIRLTAEAWGFEFMDTIPRALAEGGSRLCDGNSSAALNFVSLHPQGGTVGDLLLPTNWTHNSLHPNEAGHRLMLEAAERWFEDHPVSKLRPAPVPGEADPPVVLPDALGGGPATTPEEIAEVEAIRAGAAIVPSGWLVERAQDLAQRLALPIVLLLMGSWMVLINVVDDASRKGWSVAAKVREALRWTLAAPPSSANPRAQRSG